MNKKKELSFPLIIIAIVIGSGIYKEFDFNNLEFKNPALAAIYILGFSMSLFFIFRKPKEDKDNSQ